MRKYLTITAVVALLAGAACTPEEQIYGGAALGALGGFAMAELLDANTGWTVGLSLAGAAIGAEVARNNQTGQCAYKRADGRVDVRPC
ncbi:MULTISPECIES: hypothetical protein [Nioella]|jgi:hypothetical protein|uniref:hypothetical protein n=1 Tax=Nioella TaxID=1775424 RepID=UPI0008FD524E|nr:MULTISPECIES: hypothetical protein [Nioella]TBX28847.1 hypothetical protein TK43_03490 [Roseovarius sp. JS7-11]